MLEDPIVAEVCRVRERIAAKYGYDVRAIGRALQAEQRRGGHKTVSLEPKRLAGKAKVKRGKRSREKSGAPRKIEVAH